MDGRLNLVISFCVVGIIALSARWARKTGEWRSFWIGLLALVIFVVFLNRSFGFPFASSVVEKAGDHELLLAGAMGLCMIGGMFAQYLYRYFERPLRHRQKWDWGCFVAPMFASPIVFIPLAAAFQNVDIDLTNPNLKLPQLMVFLVAFENGFFWKEHYDQKRKQLAKGI
jgi:hypothetical protein